MCVCVCFTYHNLGSSAKLCCQYNTFFPLSVNFGVLNLAVPMVSWEEHKLNVNPFLAMEPKGTSMWLNLHALGSPLQSGGRVAATVLQQD